MKTFSKICIAAGTLAASLSSAAMAQMMGQAPVPMTVQQFSAAHIGQRVQISVRVDRVKRATLYAELLEQKTESLQKSTGRRVTLYFADGTPVVMGTAADIVPGAVVFVFGVVSKPGTVDVKKAAIDTKYVKVL